MSKRKKHHRTKKLQQAETPKARAAYEWLPPLVSALRAIAYLLYVADVFTW